MAKYIVWTMKIGLKGGVIVEAESSFDARKKFATEKNLMAAAVMARALETSEGELGYWNQGDNGPVWVEVGKAPLDLTAIPTETRAIIANALRAAADKWAGPDSPAVVLAVRDPAVAQQFTKQAAEAIEIAEQMEDF